MNSVLSNAASGVTIVLGLIAVTAGTWRMSRKLTEILRLLRKLGALDLRVARIERHLGLPPFVLPPHLREDPQ